LQAGFPNTIDFKYPTVHHDVKTACASWFGRLDGADEDSFSRAEQVCGILDHDALRVRWRDEAKKPGRYDSARASWSYLSFCRLYRAIDASYSTRPRDT
jgi:hypothetical protein